MTTSRGRQPHQSPGAEATGAATAAVGPPTADEPDAIHADIAATRADLGDSVEALAAKTDVKARAKDKAAAVTGRAKGTVQQVGRTVRSHRAPSVGVFAAVVALVGAVVVIRRRRPPTKAPIRNRLRWPR